MLSCYEPVLQYNFACREKGKEKDQTGEKVTATMGKGKGKGRDDGEFELQHCVGGLCGVIFIAVVIIIIAAFGVVEPNEMAIKYYGMSVSLDRKTAYSAGRQFVGHQFPYCAPSYP